MSHLACGLIGFVLGVLVMSMKRMEQHYPKRFVEAEQGSAEYDFYEGGYANGQR